MTAARVALDTNLLVYAQGVDGEAKKQAALDLIEKMPQDALVVPVQALGELFNVLVKNAKWPPVDARAAVWKWRDSFPLADTTASVMLRAADLATQHQLRIWDSVILAAAAEADCRLLLSEDLQDGLTWAGVTVVNPFASSRHPLLTAMLDQSR